MKHRSNGRIFKIKREDIACFPKCYGLVHRGERVFFRNYGRELKNGKGLSFLDILEEKRKNVSKNIDEYLKEKLWE